jgi:excisionase family DNA binding protein
MIETTGQNEVSGGLLTPQEAAKRMKVTDRTIYNWTRKGLLVAFKVGLVVRYSVADLDRFIEANKTTGRTG